MNRAIPANGAEDILPLDAQISALFARVEREQGRLDILVNNACALHDQLTAPGNFWEKPLEIVDMLDVGLRSGYIAGYYAAPMMVRRRSGLIVFTSASGAVHYVYGPAYGAHKAGMDKFAAGMAVDFKAYNVAVMSIWMGALLTDRLKMVIAAARGKYGHLLLVPGELPGPARAIGRAIRLESQRTLDNSASANSELRSAFFGSAYHRHVFRPACLDS